MAAALLPGGRPRFLKRARIVAERPTVRLGKDRLVQQKLLTLLDPLITVIAGGLAGWLATTQLDLGVGRSQIASALTYVATLLIAVAARYAHKLIERLPRSAALEHYATAIASSDPGDVAHFEATVKAEVDRLGQRLEAKLPTSWQLTPVITGAQQLTSAIATAPAASEPAATQVS